MRSSLTWMSKSGRCITSGTSIRSRSRAPFLDEQQFDQLRRTYRYAKYINCVRLLGGIDLEKDDYFRGVDDRGEAMCDFSEGLAMLSGIRQCGFTPWIVLDNVPAEMSENPTQNRYGNTEPPADFDLWSSYVRQFVRALVDEFGREEVAKWRFRVGTEPDLNPGHWSGTKEQYLTHYDYTVAAVLSVLPEADIGPGNIIDPVKKRKWESWGTEIIEHCATGTNHVTGEIGTPMSFFASSYYTAVGTTDERFDDLVKLLRDKLDAISSVCRRAGRDPGVRYPERRRKVDRRRRHRVWRLVAGSLRRQDLSKPRSPRLPVVVEHEQGRRHSRSLLPM